MSRPARLALLAAIANAAVPVVFAQAPSKVDYTPDPPPDATWPVFVDVGPTIGAPGTVFDNQGSGRGQAWVDLLGPDPADPNSDKTGPPDGIPDLVQINSNSPGLPLSAGPGTWTVPPVGTLQHPCVVYRGNPDASFTNVTARVTPEATDGFGMSYPGGSPWGAVCADFDDDGDTDLFVPCGGFNTESPNALFSNDGDGTLTNVSTSAGLGLSQPTFGAAWIDFDRDGDLDLFETNAAASWPEFFQGSATPDATDRLFRNDGDGTFEEIGAAAGIDIRSNGFSCSSSDLDRDGWPDLVVACFRQLNKVFYNNGDSTFSFMVPAQNTTYDFDIDSNMAPDPAFAGTEDLVGLPPDANTQLPILPEWSMPVQLDDMNGDGWPDVLCSAWSMQLPDGNPDSAEGALFGPWDQARLYLNRGDQDGDGLGDGIFREVSSEVGIAHIGGAMGLATADFNADGFLDAYFGCGGPQVDAHQEEDYLYISNGVDWPKDFQADPDQALGQIFYEVGALAGVYSNVYMGHGVTVGRPTSSRLDVLLGNGGPAVFDDGQPNVLFQNTGNADASVARYFELKIAPQNSARYGARLQVVRTPGSANGPTTIVRERRSGDAFASHNDRPLLFGLGGGDPLWAGVTWANGHHTGDLLWPVPSATSHTLQESDLSIRVQISTDSTTDVSTVHLDLESVGGTVLLPLLAYAHFGLSSAGEAELLELLPISASPLLLPNTPIGLTGKMADMPEGLHAVVAVSGLTLQVLGTGAAWHDPASAGAVFGASGLAAAPLGASPEPQEPGAGDPAPTPGSVARDHLAVGQSIEIQASTLLVARAASPVQWREYDLEAPGQLTLESGDRIAWSGGQLRFTLEDDSPAALSFNDCAPTLTTGRPAGCCDVRPIDEGQLMRFVGVEQLSVDGVGYTARGQRLAE